MVFIATFLVSCIFALWAFKKYHAAPPVINHMNISFENVTNEKIRKCFIQVMERYTDLHDCTVILVQGKLKSSTMQAQPIIGIGNLIGRAKTYRVKLAYRVRDSENLKVADLSSDVLTGWFAHELGHLVDYRNFNNLQMVFFGIKYLWSEKFKREAEYNADRIAIKSGFRKEIIATKRFILDNDLLNEPYKAKIRRYYMPIEEAEVWEHSHVPAVPDVK